MKIFRPSGRFFLTIVVLLVIGLLGGSTFYFFSRYKNTKRLLENPTEAAKIEVKELTTKLAQLIELPAKEDPTIATIIDAAKLKDQAFFARAKNGDKVILYTKAKKAILYRPLENKIIDFAPLTLDTQNTGAGTVQTPPVKISLYNGTYTSGLIQKAESDLKARYADIEVVTKENAKKRDYDKTLVVDLTGSKKDVANQLAKDLKGEAGELPKEETRPKEAVDIIVILGTAYSK